MTADLVVIPHTPAEVSAMDRFRAAELASVQARPVTADEMIDGLLAERHAIEMSARAAEAAYRAPFDPNVIRRCARLQKTAEFLGLIEQNRAAVLEALKPGSTPRRARSA